MDQGAYGGYYRPDNTCIISLNPNQDCFVIGIEELIVNAGKCPVDTLEMGRASTIHIY